MAKSKVTREPSTLETGRVIDSIGALYGVSESHLTDPAGNYEPDYVIQARDLFNHVLTCGLDADSWTVAALLRRNNYKASWRKRLDQLPKVGFQDWLQDCANAARAGKQLPSIRSYPVPEGCGKQPEWVERACEIADIEPATFSSSPYQELPFRMARVFAVCLGLASGGGLNDVLCSTDAPGYDIGKAEMALGNIGRFLWEEIVGFNEYNEKACDRFFDELERRLASNKGRIEMIETVCNNELRVSKGTSWCTIPDPSITKAKLRIVKDPVFNRHESIVIPRKSVRFIN